VHGAPHLALHDGNGSSRIGMHITDDNTPQLFLNDANETARLELNVDEDNDPDMTFSDRNGDRRLVLDMDEYGRLSPLRLYNAEGKETYRLPILQETKEG
jgi:hypothetical protein